MSSHKVKKLGWFLCWAVVFADIGTSLYYVPGILYGEVGKLSGLFVLLSSIVFVLLVIKYIEITDRYPEGGGVVTVATHAFGPWFGALGGMFITVDYFLTASISSVSGFAYLNSIIPLGNFIGFAAILGLIFLGVLNVIGIKESAKVTAFVAVLAFIVDIILIGFIVTQLGPDSWSTIFKSFQGVADSNFYTILTGFAGSFLAFSGLESISQLSPAMQTPRVKVAAKAMIFVVGAILITSPFLTLFSTNLLNEKVPGRQETILESVAEVNNRVSDLSFLESNTDKELVISTLKVKYQKEIDNEKKSYYEDQLAILNENTSSESRLDNLKDYLENSIIEGKQYSERFISELGAQYGGPVLKIAVVLTASVLLLFASNTAIIGAYHVFISLSRQRFLPQILQKNNKKFDSPHFAVALAAIPPILIIIATKGDVGLLGELYAFGLLGAFTLSSIGLDVVRWKEKKINLNFFVGLITTILVVVAWLTNLEHKRLATIFGGAITILGMAIAFLVRKNSKELETEIKVKKTSEIPKFQIFTPVFDEFDPEFFDYVGKYARNHKKDVALMYIREYTDIYQTLPEDFNTDKEAQEFITKAKNILVSYGVKVFEMYKTTSDAADLINSTRDQIRPEITIVSPHKQSLFLDFVKGNILNGIIANSIGNVLIYTGSHDSKKKND